MKKLFFLGSACMVTSLLFSSQSPAEVPTVQLNGDVLRTSTSAIPIVPAVTKKLSKKSSSSSSRSTYSSGSSPTGAELLFPGQPGIGFQISPVASNNSLERWFS